MTDKQTCRFHVNSEQVIKTCGNFCYFAALHLSFLTLDVMSGEDHNSRDENDSVEYYYEENKTKKSTKESTNIANKTAKKEEKGIIKVPKNERERFQSNAVSWIRKKILDCW